MNHNDTHIKKYDIRHRLLRFDSYRIPHANAPWIGDRYACVFYNKDLNYVDSDVCERSNHIKLTPPSDTIDILEFDDSQCVTDARTKLMEVLVNTRFPEDRTSGLTVSKKYGDSRGTFLSFGITKTRQNRENRRKMGMLTRKSFNMNNVKFYKLYNALHTYINAMIPFLHKAGSVTVL